MNASAFVRTLAALFLCLCWCTGCEPRSEKSSPADGATAPVPASATQATSRAETLPATQAVEPYEYRFGSPHGIGKWYMGREIAHVASGHETVKWLERAEREQEEWPSRLIEILRKRVEPDDVFADIGAGSGYYSVRLASLVPNGKVLAVDIEQEMLEVLTRSAQQRGIKNIEPILGGASDPRLPAGAVDYVLIVDAYHEFDHPREMMQGIYAGLRPGGKVLLVEFRGEDENVPIKPIHKMTEAQAVREMSAAGLKHIETIGELPWQHVMVFQK